MENVKLFWMQLPKVKTISESKMISDLFEQLPVPGDVG